MSEVRLFVVQIDHIASSAIQHVMGYPPNGPVPDHVTLFHFRKLSDNILETARYGRDIITMEH